MRIAFAVNDIKTELPAYTTVRLAVAAANRGHEAWLVGMGQFAYDSDELIRAHAQRAPKEKYKSSETYLSDLRGPNGVRSRINLNEFDVLMLRNDPAQDGGSRSWAQSAGINFGRMLLQQGVIVVNDPNGLSKAMNKSYFQLFPAEVRPQAIITRAIADIRAFAKEFGKIVLKPLAGSGGQGVFLLTPEMLPNLNQIVESISRDGYIIAQESHPVVHPRW